MLIYHAERRHIVCIFPASAPEIAVESCSIQVLDIPLLIMSCHYLPLRPNVPSWRDVAKGW